MILQCCGLCELAQLRKNTPGAKVVELRQMWNTNSAKTKKILVSIEPTPGETTLRVMYVPRHCVEALVFYFLERDGV